MRSIDVETTRFPFRNTRSIKGLVCGGLELLRAARRLDVDLVHVQYGSAHALIAVLFSPRRVVVSYVGSDLFGHYNNWGGKTWRGRLTVILSQLAALGACRCIAMTEELRDALWFSTCRRKCEVIPNGVDLTLFKPLSQAEARAALKWPHRNPVVLFMQTDDGWVKNPQLALAAFHKAKEIVPKLQLHIVDNEPPDRMPLIHNAADVLLITSRHEGSNNSLKEAMACNLPVVSTACGDAQQRLSGVKHCYICYPDPSELGSRLAKVAMARQRSDGREHIMAFDIRVLAHRVKRCYETALNGTRLDEKGNPF